MTMTDLGVECVVGLCMAAAIWWVARRRRTHTEGPKTRVESADPNKAVSLVDDAAAAAADEDALLAEGDTSECSEDDDTRSLHSLDDQHTADADEDDDDEEAETDVTEHDGDDDDEEEEDDNDYGEEEKEEREEEAVVMDEKMKETLARAEAMAAKMGVNVTESFMAMEEFLVLDAPLPSFEEERMRMEDPASFVHLDVHQEEEEDEDKEEDEEEDGNEDEQEEEDNEEEEEKEEHPAAASVDQPSGVMSAFWAKCEYKDECNLCNSPFSFLARRHHCRKCRASVCGGCSSKSAALAEFGGSVERVCDRCWDAMQMAAADHQLDDDGDDDEEEKTALSF